MVTPLALLSLCLAALPHALAVTVPLTMPNSTGMEHVLASACTGQGTHSVCDPFGFKKYFVKCTGSAAAPERKVCGKGRRYDYNHRKCKDMSDPELAVCPFYYCPIGREAVDRPQGQFGQPGNATFPLEKAGKFEIFCPINGHCLGGMYIEVEVECPAPLDRAPYTFIYQWVETLLNTASYPNHLANLKGFCGDTVLLTWMEPIHVATTFGLVGTLEDKLMNSVTPYPPQPLYECPVWAFDFSAGQPQSIPTEGQVVLISEGVGPKAAAWTATEVGEFFWICQAAQHCRMGMIFKVTVRSCLSDAPVEHKINWVLTYDLFPALGLCLGDIITIGWESPQMFHGVIIANGDTIKPYVYGETDMGSMEE